MRSKIVFHMNAAWILRILKVVTELFVSMRARCFIIYERGGRILGFRFVIFLKQTKVK